MEDYKYKLSIIIPMYNAEKYIANCLNSILNSDLPKGEYEVLIINDGSTDNGPQIAQEYVSKRDNFTYLTQENQGQSVARNLGINRCHGEYIWCVDSDDIICSDFKTPLDLLSCNSYDIIAFQLRIENEIGKFVRMECTQPLLPHNTPLSGRNAIISGYSPSSVCALWIRRQYIFDNDLFFKAGITHQDVELSYRLFASAKQVFFTNNAPYIYLLHSNSTSQSIKPDKKIKYLSDDIIVYQAFKALANQNKEDYDLSMTIEKRAQNVLFSLVFSLFCHRKEWKSLGINQAVIDKLKENGLYPLRGPFDSWGKKLASLLLNNERVLT